ncbi:MAG: gliding motility-associated C-terminal domain-containing protein, partial [Bacteroidia bacterium]|nr:gliding motility-associated C-terminal domain-containing protein [Bacteroidia bacterium]
GLNNPNILTPISSPAQTTVYTLTVNDSLCSAIDSVTVTVIPPLGIDAGDDLILYPDESVVLNITGPGAYTSFCWTPETGLDNTDVQNPNLEFIYVPGGQTITYKASAVNLYGCPEADSVNIRFVPFYIPKGFTPNDDGVNDTWELDYLLEYEDIVVEIYNRWGKRIFYSNGYSAPWDGKLKGKPLPAGTYYFIITIPGGINSNVPVTGSVTILR